MDTYSLLPAKRLRSSLNGSVPLNECIREFKLPKQYPSMVPKLIDMKVAKTPSRTTKIIPIRETPVTNKIRIIKLKGQDGRDLGQVNVPDLPQNIQGKTITISKNVFGKNAELISVTEKTEGIPVGVLTPVGILKTDNTAYSEEENKPTAVSVVKNPKGYIVDGLKDDNVIQSQPLVFGTKKISTSDVQNRPHVLVFQSGKNWRMLKISKNIQAEQSNVQIAKNINVTKLSTNLSTSKPNFVKIHPNKDQPTNNIAMLTDYRKVADNSVLLINKTSVPVAQCHTAVQQGTQSQTPNNMTDELKLTIDTKSAEMIKPNIRISRIVGSSIAKPSSNVTTHLVDTFKPIVKNDAQTQKNISFIKQDVMVVLPSPGENYRDLDTGIDSNFRAKQIASMKQLERMKTATSPESTSSGQTSSWRKKLLANKSNDTTKYSSSRDISSLRQTDQRTLSTGGKNTDAANISILEKALSTVKDEVLREKALKVLAECGIGIERQVPMWPPIKMKSLKDSDTQTSIFGLWEKEKFIYVPANSPGIQRIQVDGRSSDSNPNQPLNNLHSQELHLNSLEIPPWVDSECIELSNMVEGYVEGCKVAAQVANIFAKPSSISLNVVDQLEKDFNTYKEYADNGMLNIHKAVITDDVRSVRRHIMILRGCEESVDIPTRNGQTSLELAIRYQVSPEIVITLLNAGAEPTSTDTAHDSALIIASRQSLPIMKELISRVKTPAALNNYDSTGFAALHYCAQNGYQKGVEILIDATADVNLRDRRSGRTPLFHAVESNHNDLAEMLLKKGAEASIANYAGQTIYNVIDETKHYNLLEVLNRVNAK